MHDRVGPPALVLAFALVLPLSFQSHLAAQGAAPSPAAAGSALAAKAVAALDRGADLSSVRLAGTVTRTLGTPETGTVVLEADGPAASRVEYDLPSGNRIEMRGDDAHGAPWGAWIGPDGNAHTMALRNCWAPADWFLPQWAALIPAHADQAATAVAAPAGQQAIQVQRRLARQGPAAAAAIARLSTAVLDLDAATALPLSLHYALHPDNGAATPIPVEVRYGDYQNVDGVEFPFHIQLYLQRSLDYDIYISNAEINTTLPAADFSEPPGVAAAYQRQPTSVQGKR